MLSQTEFVLKITSNGGKISKTYYSKIKKNSKQENSVYTISLAKLIKIFNNNQKSKNKKNNLINSLLNLDEKIKYENINENTDINDYQNTYNNLSESLDSIKNYQINSKYNYDRLVLNKCKNLLYNLKWFMGIIIIKTIEINALTYENELELKKKNNEISQLNEKNKITEKELTLELDKKFVEIIKLYEEKKYLEFELDKKNYEIQELNKETEDTKKFYIARLNEKINELSILNDKHNDLLQLNKKIENIENFYISKLNEQKIITDLKEELEKKHSEFSKLFYKKKTLQKLYNDKIKEFRYYEYNRDKNLSIIDELRAKIEELKKTIENKNNELNDYYYIKSSINSLKNEIKHLKSLNFYLTMKINTIDSVSKPNINDPYKILGIPKNSSKEFIRCIYKKLAQIYHPDKLSGFDETFKLINSAYEKLIS